MERRTTEPWEGRRLSEGGRPYHSTPSGWTMKPSAILPTLLLSAALLSAAPANATMAFHGESDSTEGTEAVMNGRSAYGSSLSATNAASKASATPKPGTFTTGKGTFLLNGEPFVVKAAELHYPRIPRAYWEHRIKMCKALGMNTVCIYVFWNIHEQREGEFDFTGNNDVAEFCRIAQRNGMYVIVRPGPYVCAEWEMGGLPWWLLKKKNIRLRESDPYFLERVEKFEQEVGKQLAPLTIQNGGPIIMVQVENEYGSYGTDKAYVSAIRDIVRRAGFDQVTLFQCDWASNFELNGLDDLTWTMNFGTGANIDNQFRRLGELRPDAPKMCSEFWSGWFDKWGARHETRPAQAMVDGMDEMLSKGISFSLYMTHGGTSFGHWAGSNSPGYQPDVTSYDYDAPINEYGQATPKFYELRRMMAKYNDGKALPAVPKAPMPIISVPQFSLSEFVPLTNGTDRSKALTASAIKTFEELDMGWGTTVYRTTLPPINESTTLTATVHDFAIVYLNGRRIGTIDRSRGETAIELPPLTAAENRLTMVVEAMGRINFGRAIKDYKGIVGPVKLSYSTSAVDVEMTPQKWDILPIPDDYDTALRALAEGTDEAKAETFGTDEAKAGGAGYYRGYFTLKKAGDTFLNLESFGKGQAYVNGHAIGRFWHVGPQQTLYVPGCWLRKGQNEVIVLDVLGPETVGTENAAQPTAYCAQEHELDKLHLTKSNKHNEPGNRMDLNSDTPVLQGEFKSGNGWQTLPLPQPAEGRYFALECSSTHDDAPQLAIAEVYLLDENGERIDRTNWVAHYADSEKGNSTLDKMFDLQESTYWQTERSAAFPHLAIVDMGTSHSVSAIQYLPRAEQGAPGSVKGFKLYLRK